jgi:DNA-binding MarR family transcriptional regulator
VARRLPPPAGPAGAGPLPGAAAPRPQPVPDPGPRPAPAPFRLDRSFTHRLHTLGKLTDRLTAQAYLADAGIALGEGRCLSAVASFGPLSVNDLATLANLTKGQASRAAQVLVARGLVHKAAAPDDGRGVLLSMAPAGTALWARLQQVIARRNDEITGCLSARERALLDGLLDRLVAHARTVAGSAPDPDLA